MKTKNSCLKKCLYHEKVLKMSCKPNHLSQSVNSTHLQMIPEAFKNSQPGSLLKTAVMGKASDLTDVQKDISDTL